MNNKSSSVIFLLTIVMIFLMMNSMRHAQQQQQPTIVVKPTLARAQDLEKQSGNDVKKLSGDVVNAYRAVADADPESEDAAKARLQIGIIEQTKVKNGTDAAIDEYAALLRDFSSKNYPEIAAAKQHLSEIDQRNKTNTAWGGAYLYAIIDFLVALTGRNPAFSYVLALLIITLVFKFITTPLSHAQFKQMREMQRIQPLVKDLQ